MGMVSVLIVKRYPNRKLYDTVAKGYVSLERIADLIRGGVELRVLDHVSNEDLTTLILTQIIVEQEKQQAGFLPLAVLTGLVQAGGNTLAALRRSLIAPLDLSRQVDEEICRRVDRLIELGELAEEDGRRLSARLLELGPACGPDELLDLGEVERIVRGQGLLSRSEFQELVDLVDALTAEVEALEFDPSSDRPGEVP